MQEERRFGNEITNMGTRYISFQNYQKVTPISHFILVYYTNTKKLKKFHVGRIYIIRCSPRIYARNHFLSQKY